MTTYFVKSTGTDNIGTNNGQSWADGDAWATLVYAMSQISGAGHAVVVGSGLDQAINAGTIAGSATRGNPRKFISATEQSSGAAVVYSAGARFDRNGGAIQPTGSFECYGLTIAVENSSQLYFGFDDNAGIKRFIDCTLITPTYYWAYGSYAMMQFINCTMTAGGTGTSSLFMTGSAGTQIECYDCTFTSTSGSATYALFYASADETLRAIGCDYSGVSTITKLAIMDKTGKAHFAGCRLPSGWSAGDLNSQFPNARITVERSDNAAQTQVAQGLKTEKTYHGTITHDTSNYRNGGSTDGTTPYSWKFTGDATYCTFFLPLVGEFAKWIEGDGTGKTLTIHFASDSSLDKSKVWFDVFYPSATASHRDDWQTSRGDVLAASPGTYTAGDAWTGSTVTNKYKHSFSIAPDYPGPVLIRVYSAEVTNPVYVCRKAEIA